MAADSAETDSDKSYSTCVETYSTLRVFSDGFPPEEITKRLGIEPTDAFPKGEIFGQGKLLRKTNGWFYCTKAQSNSNDTRCHIDLILAALDGKAASIRDLSVNGCDIDIFSFWVSSGQGGPCLTSKQMLKLGELGIDVGWDVYLDDEDAS